MYMGLKATFGRAKGTTKKAGEEEEETPQKDKPIVVTETPPKAPQDSSGKRLRSWAVDDALLDKLREMGMPDDALPTTGAMVGQNSYTLYSQTGACIEIQHKSSKPTRMSFFLKRAAPGKKMPVQKSYGFNGQKPGDIWEKLKPMVDSL